MLQKRCISPIKGKVWFLSYNLYLNYNILNFLLNFCIFFIKQNEEILKPYKNTIYEKKILNLVRYVLNENQIPWILKFINTVLDNQGATIKKKNSEFILLFIAQLIRFSYVKQVCWFSLFILYFFKISLKFLLPINLHKFMGKRNTIVIQIQYNSYVFV